MECCTTPKVSVVMPSLNVAPYIRECIKSALNQTMREVEVLCVDAGSTDGTLEILEEYAQKDPRVKLIHSDIKSYGHQMNLGFDTAQGEFVAILETDDYILPQTYEVLYQAAQSHHLDLVKSDYEIFLGDGAERTFTYMQTCKKKSQYHKVYCPAETPDIFNARMNTWTGLYRRSFIQAHNIRHNETAGASYQDNGFWFQTFLWAKRIMFLDRAFYQLRRDNPNSSVHNKGKVFCIFEEYAFIESILRGDLERERIFISMFHKKKFDNCLYHYGRVGDEFKLDFLYRMRDEFRQARASGELDLSLFTGHGADIVSDIMDNTEEYYFRTAQPPAADTPEQELIQLRLQLEASRQEVNKLKHSRAYKLGSRMLCIPRKLRGGMDCLKENGLDYTIRHAFEKLGKKLKKS